MRTLATCLALLVLLAGCSGDDDHLTVPITDPLTTTAWVEYGYDRVDGSVVYRPVERLEGEVVGYAFGSDGSVTYRSFGFCATPPLSYSDVVGTWRRTAPDVIELDMGGEDAWGSGVYEIVELSFGRLELRRYEPDPE